MDLRYFYLRRDTANAEASLENGSAELSSVVFAHFPAWRLVGNTGATVSDWLETNPGTAEWNVSSEDELRFSLDPLSEGLIY